MKKQTQTTNNTWRRAQKGAANLKPGTLLYIEPFDYDGVIIKYNLRADTFYGYGDGGTFIIARHEAGVYEDQSRIDSFKPLRLYMPYGQWQCADGTEVLFNRDYCALWARLPDGKVIPRKANTWINHEDTSYHYESAKVTPWHDKATLKHCWSILKDWGVADQIPHALERFNLLLESNDANVLINKTGGGVFPATKAA